MKHTIFSIIIALFSQLAFSAATDIDVPLRFDHYYTYEQVNEALQALNKAYPGLSSLEMVGRSEENREIWAV